jgi:hypothetical protein
MSYSFIGIDSLKLKTETLNIDATLFNSEGDGGKGTILHEFGHAIGVPHVFQHPDAVVDFRFYSDDRGPGLYSLLTRPPHEWPRNLIDLNLRLFRRICGPVGGS